MNWCRISGRSCETWGVNKRPSRPRVLLAVKPDSLRANVFLLSENRKNLVFWNTDSARNMVVLFRLEFKKLVSMLESLLLGVPSFGLWMTTENDVVGTAKFGWDSHEDLPKSIRAQTKALLEILSWSLQHGSYEPFTVREFSYCYMMIHVNSANILSGWIFVLSISVRWLTRFKNAWVGFPCIMHTFQMISSASTSQQKITFYHNHHYYYHYWYIYYQCWYIYYHYYHYQPPPLNH